MNNGGRQFDLFSWTRLSTQCPTAHEHEMKDAENGKQGGF
jgi:hypothetical protein